MTTNQIDRFFQILGVSHNASIAEIKRAYRKRAKYLHPDRNSSPKAHEEFLELNEAFDFILEFQTEKQQAIFNNSHSNQAENSQQAYESMAREKVKRYVKKHVKMNSHEYLHSEEYKLYSSIEVFGTHFVFLIAFFSLLILPILLIYNFGVTGVIMSVMANIFMLLFTMSAVRNLHKIDLKEFSTSLLYLLKTKYVKSFFIVLFNLYIFLEIGLNTFITLNAILMYYVVLAVIAALIVLINSIRTKSKVNSFHLYFVTTCIAPGIISLLLLINYSFSSDTRIETFKYKSHVLDTYSRGKYWKKKTGLIELENNVYAEYVAIRSFSGNEKLKSSGTITYTIEKGLFGIKVMKNYHLS
jgi:hypothetical protein